MARITKENEQNQVDEAVDYKALSTKLQDEVNELKAMMKQFVENQKTESDKNATISGEVSGVEIDDEIEIIQPNKMINVTSLFYGGMSLKGNNNKIIRFEKFGMTLPITFEDLTYISTHHRNLAEEGAFYIHNKNVIKSLYLEESYKKIINKEKMENILDLDESEIRRILTNTTDQIKESIYDIVLDGVKKYLKGGDNMKFSNRNKIALISEICGKKDIYQVANEEVMEDNK